MTTKKIKIIGEYIGLSSSKKNLPFNASIEFYYHLHTNIFIYFTYANTECENTYAKQRLAKSEETKLLMLSLCCCSYSYFCFLLLLPSSASRTIDDTTLKIITNKHRTNLFGSPSTAVFNL